MPKSLISLFVILIIAFVTTNVTFNTVKSERHSILIWDVSGYHIYLPAIFIYKDLAQLSFYDHIDEAYHPTGVVKKYAQHPNAATGKILNKYPIGVAIFQMPFFLIADEYCKQSKKFPRDGYAQPYQLATQLSTILFVCLGLILLRSLLLAYAKDIFVAITLVVLLFGTNLYHYTAIDQGYSHVYSFFLLALILYTTQKWYQQKRFLYACIIGLACGLAVATRPTNIFFIIIPLLWNLKELNIFLAHFLKNVTQIIFTIICFLIPVLVQLAYWKYITGHWIYYSYENEHFEFSSPHILEGLFSYQKGWFVYTPLALLGFIGIVYMYFKRMHRTYIFPFLVYYIISIYVIFSWQQWYYGGSFGSRVMIDSLPALALPICLLTQYVFQRTRLLMTFYSLLLIAGMTLNIFQSWQYIKAIIHWDSMNKAYYWRVFGKQKITDEDRKLLE